MNVLSTYHPALLAMQSLHDQFPGALELYTFCNDNGVKCYYTEGKNRQLFTPINLSNKNLFVKIQQFRNQKKKVFWGDKEDLPIETRKKALKQLSIQDEIEQNVLVFTIQSKTDELNDVFAICFSKTFSNFYLPSRHNTLSSELKKSIGATIASQIEWLYRLHESQKENINRIQHAYHQNAKILEQKQHELDFESKTNRDLLHQYLKQLIKEYETALNCNLILDDGFIDQIIASKIEISAIDSILKKAVLTAYDLAFDTSAIQLTANLILPTSSLAPTKKSIQLVALEKTTALLDKYEKAAQELINTSQPVNGKNLAKTLKISGPAITDAIKKHRHKIGKLIEKHPKRWPLILDYIKPIREIKHQLIREVR